MCVKEPGHGIDHPPAYNAKVKERVELYFSPLGLHGLFQNGQKKRTYPEYFIVS